MLCECHKIEVQDVTHTLTMEEIEKKGEEGKTKEEEEFDEEKLCNICYFREKDTVFLPCGHHSCLRCIQVHTQNR